MYSNFIVVKANVFKNILISYIFQFYTLGKPNSVFAHAYRNSMSKRLIPYFPLHSNSMSMRLIPYFPMHIVIQYEQEADSTFSHVQYSMSKRLIDIPFLKMVKIITAHKQISECTKASGKYGNRARKLINKTQHNFLILQNFPLQMYEQFIVF